MSIRSAFITLFLSIFCSTAFAESPPIFFNTYTRTIGKPNTFQDTFRACNTGATYKLVVENGEGGKGRLSSASISLNEQEVVRENEFNQRIDKVEKAVTLQSDNTLDIKLAAGPGGFIKASIFCVSGCLDVKITFPSDNSNVNRSKTIIQGSLSNAYGEVGLTLQSSGASGRASVLAETQGNSFAGIAPLQQGQNIVTATATDACGYQAHDAITITTESIQKQIRLTANPQSGIPDATGTFNTTLEADASLPDPVSSYSWDTDGDGTVDQSGSGLSKITAAYQTPGLYFPKVTVTDSQNNAYTETAIINVLSKEQIDAMLKGKWGRMKAAMGREDIETTLNYFTSSSKEKYTEVFTMLKEYLPSIAANMRDIDLVSVIGDVAEYRINRIEDIDGQSMEITYFIYFTKDGDGLWKIESF